MKFAFVLFKYFPYGGLQRDFLRIAKTCARRQHDVHVYTREWQGAIDPQLHVRELTQRGLQNHAINRAFAAKLKEEMLVESYDLVIGFNKMPHLDIYYAADVCYQKRAREKHHSLYRLLPRYREQLAMEKAVFNRGLQTQILLIAHQQQKDFQHFYQTESSRFHLLPPGIHQERITTVNSQSARKNIRDDYRLTEDDRLCLLVGSGFKTKGLDRAIQAVAALPASLKSRTRLFVIGQDRALPFMRLAKQLRIENQIHFLGARDDVAEFLYAADLLLHPAYHENTGTVLLEAVVAGLPVLTVETCGYAAYITEANAGIVLATPFVQKQLNKTLETMLTSNTKVWRENALTFAASADIYTMPERAADLIEQIGQKKNEVLS